MAKATAARLAARETEAPKKTHTVYVPSVDGFRGLAVLWIVLFHCWIALGRSVPAEVPPLRYLLATGYFGLDSLFLISGFVLFLPAAMDQGNIGDRVDYARRRWARIVPAFWAATLFSYVVAEAVGEPAGGVGAWFSHFAFLHQYAHTPDDIGFGVDGAMWTMSVEIVFYALLPVVAARYYRHPFLGLSFAMAGAELWHVVAVKLPVIVGWVGLSGAGVEDAQRRLAYAFPSYLTHFAVGMTAAWLFVRVRSGRFGFLSPSLASAVAAAALIVLAGMAYLQGQQDDLQANVGLRPWVMTIDRTFLFGVLVLATALATPRAQWLTANAFSRLAGTVSYGIYLSHMPLIVLLTRALGLRSGTASSLDLVVLVAAVVPLSIAAGITSYGALEEPFRRWARRRPPHRSPRAPSRRKAALAGAQQW